MMFYLGGLAVVDGDEFDRCHLRAPDLLKLAGELDSAADKYLSNMIERGFIEIDRGQRPAAFSLRSAIQYKLTYTLNRVTGMTMKQAAIYATHTAQYLYHLAELPEPVVMDELPDDVALMFVEEGEHQLKILARQNWAEDIRCHHSPVVSLCLELRPFLADLLSKYPDVFARSQERLMKRKSA
jgi:hypothetical protein